MSKAPSEPASAQCPIQGLIDLLRASTNPALSNLECEVVAARPGASRWRFEARERQSVQAKIDLLLVEVENRGGYAVIHGPYRQSGQYVAFAEVKIRE